jgi:hypothetical protein
MDDFQQCGFTRSIMTDQADTVAVARHKRDVAKQKIASEVDREFVDLDHESLEFSRDAVLPRLQPLRL